MLGSQAQTAASVRLQMEADVAPTPITKGFQMIHGACGPVRARDHKIGTGDISQCVAAVGLLPPPIEPSSADM
jgi:hypothetical protein